MPNPVDINNIKIQKAGNKVMVTWKVHTHSYLDTTFAYTYCKLFLHAYIYVNLYSHLALQVPEID